MIPSPEITVRGRTYYRVYPVYIPGERPSMVPPKPVRVLETWLPEGARPPRQARIFQAVTHQPRTARQIAEAMGCPISDTSTALGKLAAAGKVLREGTPRYYTYRLKTQVAA